MSHILIKAPLLIGIIMTVTSWPAIAQAPAIGALSSEQERTLKPKDVFKECKECPEMVVVPAGAFTMGSPKSEERWYNEGPQHKVVLSKPFAVGRFAVTHDEWAVCVAEGDCKDPNNDFGWGRGRRPVVNVTWNDAKAYVAWLSKKTGKPYRLLTEAEREYVTRAGTTTPFWWGSSISTVQANYNGNETYGGGQKGENRKMTMPVDSFSPNGWGLYQVHGNVSEWVEDCFHEDYAGAPADGTAWISGECRRRVIRGGSWNFQPLQLRSASRRQSDVGVNNSSTGLRVARSF
jgi:formylglycine-generating enzyme required for sulfatase activity